MSVTTQPKTSESCIHLDIVLDDLKKCLALSDDLRGFYSIVKTESHDQMIGDGISLIATSASGDYLMVFDSVMKDSGYQPVRLTEDGAVWKDMLKKGFFIEDADSVKDGDASQQLQIFTFNDPEHGNIKCSFFDLTS